MKIKKEKAKMHYGEIKENDIANGIGVRVTLFVSGCTNHCKECFQPETWDFDYGNLFTKDTEDEIMAMLSKKYIDGLTILGGEPFEPKNQKVLLQFIKRVRQEMPEKTIWSFSGFTLEELLDESAYPHCAQTEEILGLTDVLVDGRYEAELRDLSLKFRGSSNQRLIDLKASLENGKVILWDEKQANK